MDPLSISAGIAGFLSLGLEVTKSLIDFYRAYKDQDADIADMIRELDHLCVAFVALDESLKNRDFSPGKKDILSAIEEAIGECTDYIEELQHQAEKFMKHQSESTWVKVAAGTRRLAYPFKKTMLEKLKGDIFELRSSVNFMLQIVQKRDIEELSDDLGQVKDLLEVAHSTTLSLAVKEWLGAPDPTDLYNDACRKRQPGTGLWFVRGEDFESWLKTRASFLWVYGFAGTGKSLLCCTAIQHAFRHRRSNPRIGIGFYFFSFADTNMQTASGMLRSSILQLSSQREDLAFLKQLYDTYSTATPPVHALLGCFLKLVRSFDDVYLFLDGLDECPHDAYQPRDSNRDELLETITVMRRWGDTGLHVLVTSRDEWDIQEALCALPTKVVSMQNDFVHSDIANYIDSQLRERKRLQKWSKNHTRIKEQLTRRADGVFRWVDCQFGALENCLTLAQLKVTLSTLPSTLSETYERVLATIPEHHAEHARRILHILCCAFETVGINELLRLSAVEIGTESARYDPEDQIRPELIRSICPGFLHVAGYSVQFAHSSVQEYLESKDIGKWDKKAERFRFDRNKGHAMMTCIYLAHFLFDALPNDAEEGQNGHPDADGNSEGQTEWVSEPEFEPQWYLDLDPDTKIEVEETARRSFLRNAAVAWLQHYRKIVNSNEQQLPRHLILRLFRDDAAFSRYETCLYGIPHHRHHPPQCWHGVQIYTAASLGLDFVVASLLDDASWWKGSQPFRYSDMLNHEWRADTLLHAAARNGHTTTVQLLLDRGVEVDICRGVDVCLLSGSMCPWFLETSRMYREEVDGTALLEAAWEGHNNVVALLLDRGANINFRGSIDRTTVELLYSECANINNQGAIQGTALHAASYQREEAVVKLLLSRGADATIQGGLGGTALQAAASPFPPSEPIIRLLLDHGADVNGEGGVYGTALQAAALRGEESVVRLLLSRGAHVDAEGGIYGTALQAAASKGEMNIVRLLLDHGADVNVQSGQYGTALIAGAAQNSGEIVDILLKHGADASVRANEFGTAFEVTYKNGLLLDSLDVLFRHGLVPDAKRAKVRRALRKCVWPRLPRPYIIVEDPELLVGLSSMSLYENEY
ncbi:ankyrin repeat-containing protein [Purpureocillium lilacinum]|uniref:Ankyrin repeat-containing protein n=1 Tax=Purpureocillium lilacinum TaxID=33203 RepID=A0A179FEK1_PURLI|nr:ankyrin repeat-containing protein [Purpureocillium lilacinum]OAQ63778.1 ankyrin repeat-containing protein [Purpureocillium lilacinum]